MVEQKALFDKMFNDFVNMHGQMYRIIINLGKVKIGSREFNNALSQLVNYVKYFGTLLNHYKTSYNKISVSEAQENIRELVKFANFLDDQNAYSLADKVTEVAVLIKHAYIPKMRGTNVEKKETPIQPTNESSLSTRYCPDHIGIQAIRVAEYVYQCPIDGKIYDYKSGYMNYKGQRVPGGSISEQTPTSSDYGGIPMRIYDGRQNVINTLN